MINQGKYVFSQIMELISHKVFTACVNRYKGDLKTKQFSRWKQFLVMAFGQLTQAVLPRISYGRRSYVKFLPLEVLLTLSIFYINCLLVDRGQTLYKYCQYFKK